MTGDIAELSVSNKTISDADGSSKITKSQVEIVRLLAKAYPERVPRNTIVTALWPGDAPESAENIISVHMCHLRQKVSESGMQPLFGARGFIAIRPVTVLNPIIRYIEIDEDLLEDIAGLLETHHNRHEATDLIARLPTVMA